MYEFNIKIRKLEIRRTFKERNDDMRLKLTDFQLTEQETEAERFY